MVVNKGKIFGFPKGHAKENETPKQTARREVFEETNIQNIEFENGTKEFVAFGNIIVFFVVHIIPLETELKSNDDIEILSAKFVNISRLDKHKMRISKLTSEMLPWLKAYSRSQQIPPVVTSR